MLSMILCDIVNRIGIEGAGYRKHDTNKLKNVSCEYDRLNG